MHPRALEFRRHCSPLILGRITHSTRIRFESAWRGWPEVDEPETTFHSARYLIDRPRRSRRLILRGRSARFDEEIAGWRCHKGTGTCTRLASPFLPATRPSSEKLLPVEKRDLRIIRIERVGEKIYLQVIDRFFYRGETNEG